MSSGPSSPQASSIFSSRPPSPFELREAHRITIEDPYGGIQMVDLSSGVHDAFENARREMASLTPSRSPSPGPSIAPSIAHSMASRVDGSPVLSRLPSASSIDTHSTAPIFPTLQVVEDDHPTPMQRTCSACLPVTMGATVIGIAVGIGFYVYQKTHHG